MPKIQEVKGRFFISLPASLVRAKRWKKGTELAAAFGAQGGIEFIEAKPEPK